MRPSRSETFSVCSQRMAEQADGRSSSRRFDDRLLEVIGVFYDCNIISRSVFVGDDCRELFLEI